MWSLGTRGDPRLPGPKKNFPGLFPLLGGPLRVRLLLSSLFAVAYDEDAMGETAPRNKNSPSTFLSSSSFLSLFKFAAGT